MPSRFDRRLRIARTLTGAGLLLALAGCGTVVLNETGSLSRYDRLAASEEVATRSRLYADPAALSQARTVRIVPTRFPESVSGPGLNAVERRLIANAADRALCYELSLRYDVVSTKSADLTVRAAVTRAWDDVRAGGVEPPRPLGHQDLSLARLPFRHARSPSRVGRVRYGRSVRPRSAR